MRFKKGDVLRILDIEDNEGYADVGFIFRCQSEFAPPVDDPECATLEVTADYTEFIKENQFHELANYSTRHPNMVTATVAGYTRDSEVLWWTPPLEDKLEPTEEWNVNWENVLSQLQIGEAVELHKWLKAMGIR
jgi:hypothetical protein